MVARVQGAVLTGIDATIVQVECELGNGLPSFTIVGLPDTSVQEARERVRAAIHNSGHDFPMRRITMNLAPSDVRKHGPGLDLAMALGLLVASDVVTQAPLDRRLVLGELGLSGEVRCIRGALASAEAARRAGFTDVICPAPNAPEAALAGLPVLPVRSLGDALAILRGQSPDPVRSDAAEFLSDPPPPDLDLSLIRDQDRAKRALEIAAAGAHNILMSGPPGSGKTLLAKALPGILPRMTVDEALEVTRIHSAAGILPPGDALVRHRPFRTPHSTASQAAMIGSGSSGYTRPGEVSIAHRGVLMMDEFPEFPRSCLEALRQPLEDGFVTVVRARHAVTYPARFQLVASMNPCPCGNLGSGPCRCTPHARQAYAHRLSGPLLDRIDLHVTVPRVDAEELLAAPRGESSSAIRARVEAARALHGRPNAEIPPGELLRVCRPDAGALSALGRAGRRYRLSARSVHRMLRVGRTIADVAGRDHVTQDDLLEALSYRVVESKGAEEQAS